MKPDHWIATHWPVPETDLPFSRHVYVKSGRKRVPRPGDIVFFRESITAIVSGKLAKEVMRHHDGQRKSFKAPRGSGGIIGRAVVVGAKRRKINDSDVVFNYGDLEQWEIIDCDAFRPVRLSMAALLDAVKMKNPIGLSLWKIRDDILPRLLKKLGN